MSENTEVKFKVLQIGAETARKTLLGLWLSFFCLNLCGVFYLYLGNWIERDNFRAFATLLNSCYVNYVGMMATFYLGSSRKQSKAKAKAQAGTPFAIALASSLMWNAVVTAFVLRLILKQGTVEDSIDQIGFFIPLLSWLVAPALGFYFANSTTNRSGAEVVGKANEQA